VWLYIPTSAYSQAEPVSTSLSESQSQRLAASAVWRSKRRLPRLWRLAWKKEHWIRRLSGVTLDPSTADRFVEEWMGSLVGSRARIFPPLENEQGSKEGIAADSSSSTSESFARFGPGGSLLKTSPQYSIFDQAEPYSGNLPDSGSMRNGYLYARPTLKLRTSGSDPSSWLTPHGMNGIDHTGKVGAGGEFAKQATSWPTPNTPSGGPNTKSTATHTGGMDLDGAALMWGTPTSRDHKDGACETADVETNGLLGRQVVRNWPTPTRQDSASAANATAHRSDGSQHYAGVTLTDAIRLHWPTPNAHPEAPNASTTRENGREAKRITDQCLASVACQSSLRAQATPQPGSESSPSTRTSRQPSVSSISSFISFDALVYCRWAWSARGSGVPYVRPSMRRRLNQRFVEWLMNWPIGWTSARTPLDPAAMELWVSRERSHLRSSLSGQDSGSEVRA
jgi:hypothetical protein